MRIRSYPQRSYVDGQDTPVLVFPSAPWRHGLAGITLVFGADPLSVGESCGHATPVLRSPFPPGRHGLAATLVFGVIVTGGALLVVG